MRTRPPVVALPLSALPDIAALTQLGNTLRDHVQAAITIQATDWLIVEGLTETDWADCRVLELDLARHWQPIQDLLAIEQWLTTGFIPAAFGSVPDAAATPPIGATADATAGSAGFPFAALVGPPTVMAGDTIRYVDPDEVTADNVAADAVTPPQALPTPAYTGVPSPTNGGQGNEGAGMASPADQPAGTDPLAPSFSGASADQEPTGSGDLQAPAQRLRISADVAPTSHPPTLLTAAVHQNPARGTIEADPTLLSHAPVMHGPAATKQCADQPVALAPTLAAPQQVGVNRLAAPSGGETLGGETPAIPDARAELPMGTARTLTPVTASAQGNHNAGAPLALTQQHLLPSGVEPTRVPAASELAPFTSPDASMMPGAAEPDPPAYWVRGDLAQQPSVLADIETTARLATPSVPFATAADLVAPDFSAPDGGGAAAADAAPADAAPAGRVADGAWATPSPPGLSQSGAVAPTASSHQGGSTLQALAQRLPTFTNIETTARLATPSAPFATAADLIAPDVAGATRLATSPSVFAIADDLLVSAAAEAGFGMGEATPFTPPPVTPTFDWTDTALTATLSSVASARDMLAAIDTTGQPVAWLEQSRLKRPVDELRTTDAFPQQYGGQPQDNPARNADDLATLMAALTREILHEYQRFYGA